MPALTETTVASVRMNVDVFIVGVTWLLFCGASASGRPVGVRSCIWVEASASCGGRMVGCWRTAKNKETGRTTAREQQQAAWIHALAAVALLASGGPVSLSE